MERIITKTPNELELLTIDYSEGLVDDFIQSDPAANKWNSTDAALTISNPQLVGQPPQAASAFIGGGVVNGIYYADNYIISDAGRILETSTRIFIVQYNFLDDIIYKGPDQDADYTIQWNEDLATGDTIINSTWYLDDSSLILNAGLFSINVDKTSATAWISGGTLGQTYILTNLITTGAGRILEKSIKVSIVAHGIQQGNFLTY